MIVDPITKVGNTESQVKGLKLNFMQEAIMCFWHYVQIEPPKSRTVSAKFELAVFEKYASM